MAVSKEIEVREKQHIPAKLLAEIKAENEKRLRKLLMTYNPLTGEGTPQKRCAVTLTDYLGGKRLYVPLKMLEEEPFARALVASGSIDGYIAKYMGDYDARYARTSVWRRWERLRCKYDPYYFAYAYARIKSKEGGAPIPFLMRSAQVEIVEECLRQLKEIGYIRIDMLKCRQFGGSTVIQFMSSWITIFWKRSWNMYFVGHQSTSATTVMDMFELLLDHLPLWLLHDTGDNYDDNEKKLKGSATTTNIKYIPPRGTKIQTATALNPEAVRSADSSIAHLTETAFFPETEKFHPRDIVKSAISSIGLLPWTMIVNESSPNGHGNNFHSEWIRAKEVDDKGQKVSSYYPVYIPWQRIDSYILPVRNIEAFVDKLWQERNDEVYYGKYCWHLWRDCGATIEGIAWWKQKVKDYDSIEDMMQEFSSDDVEAFKYSGKAEFDIYALKSMEEDCEKAIFTGVIEGDSVIPQNKSSVENLRLVQQSGGELKVWAMPDTEQVIKDRYLVSVDIGGSHKTSDYWDIVVFDRHDRMYGGVPEIVAEWHGHGIPDQMAMTCAQIAIFYCNAELVVEANTAYSRMNNIDGDVSEIFFPTLLNLYDNLYGSRKKSATTKRKGPEVSWGFWTSEGTKVSLVKNLSAMVKRHGYVEKEMEAITEYTFYMQFPNGKYGNAPGKHDDRVMARGIGLFVEKDMDMPKVMSPAKKEEGMVTKKWYQ